MTEGVEYVYRETHDWGKTVKFWLEFGYELARDWCDSHWGTRLLELRDPDGRTIIVQHPGA